MSIHGTPKSMTLWEKVRFFFYTGIWPKEVKMYRVDPKEFKGIPKVTKRSNWVDVKEDELG